MKKKNVFFLTLFIIFVFIPVISIFSATITIDTTSGRAAISPYIYGVNDDSFSKDANFTCRRQGGNRMTGYNWENNASNAGADWYNSSDSYMCPASVTDCINSPGASYEYFVNYNLSKGYDSLITIPMAGYVAADMNGDVTAAQTAPSSRWHPVYFAKGSAFSFPPDTGDNAVYMDESVWHLTQLFGNASTATGVKFYDLDNEPGIWNSTHPYLHPKQVTCKEYVASSITLTAAIKNVDPYAKTFGGVFYGWTDYMNLNSSDWATEGAGYNWFVSYYLAKMNAAGTAAGKRLLDVIDFHYYSEAKGGGYRITDSSAAGYPVVNQTERMNATRTLWEAGYMEDSWIGQYYPQFTALIPLINSSINTYYPGTKVSFSEWNFGGGKHFSGGLADTDFLGLMGKYGVYLATMWPVDEGIYSAAAFKIYRNYDGAKSTFGDTHVTADSSTSTLSVYASISGADESNLHVILVNKYPTAQSASVAITSSQTYSSMQAYGFDSTSGTITARATAVISSNAFTYSMPAYSAIHFILKSNTTPTQTVNRTASPTFTVTPTRTATEALTPTVTATKTLTPTITPTFTTVPIAAADVIYDGDSYGTRLIDGTVTSGGSGTLTEASKGDPGNGMVLSYVSPAYWQQHEWVLGTAKSVGSNTYLAFDIRQDVSSANTAMYFQVATSWSTGAAWVLVDNYVTISASWQTVYIPLSALMGTDTSISFIDFASNMNVNSMVDIDNIRLVNSVFTATPTGTRTIGAAATFTATLTVSFTGTFTTTVTMTPTITNTPTYTPSVTQTITGTPPTDTMTPTYTSTYTPTPVFTATSSGTITLTSTLTPVITYTPTSEATATATGAQTDAAGDAVIYDVLTYPNPVRGSGTKVTVRLDAGFSPVSIKMAIYTQAFRLIKKLEWSGADINSEKEASFTIDKLGSPANGDYFYIIEAGDRAGRKVMSKIGIMVIIK